MSTSSHSYQTDAGRRRRGRRAYTLGRLVITTVDQGGHAPFADRCGGTILDGKNQGRAYWGRAFLLAPWMRDRWGETVPQLALVIGWMEKRRTTPTGRRDGVTE